MQKFWVEAKNNRKGWRLTGVLRLMAMGLVLWIFSAQTRAGGGPQNVLVVMNEQSRESVELARYYQQHRDIPERNVCRISTDPDQYNISYADCRKEILDPIAAYLREQNLQDQIDFIVLSKDLPTRVNDIESITGVLYYGYRKAPGIAPPTLPCSMPEDTRNPYFYAERSFHRDPNYRDGLGCLAMVLSARTLEESKMLVDRSVAADRTAPAGTFYLLNPPGDSQRNVRHFLFENFMFHAEAFKGFPAYQVLNVDAISGKKDILGYLTGRPNIPDLSGSTNTYLPGAICDHLTSVAGYLPIHPLNQSTIWDWIHVGASASYGTVSEPCAMLPKFPDPMVFFWYARGFNLAESYWMSVANPYQGLFAGDPLCAPYAQPPTVSVTNLVPGQIVSGAVTVHVEVVAADVTRPCAELDMYVDDLFVSNLVKITPYAWNTLEARVAEESYSYVVTKGDRLVDAVQGLARAINRKSPEVKAFAAGDRLTLIDGRIGLGIPRVDYSVATSAGLANDVTLGGQAMTSWLQPGPNHAKKSIRLTGDSRTGDRVQVTVTLTSGLSVTQAVVAAEDESTPEILRKLIAHISANAQLSGPDGVQNISIRNYARGAEAVLEARSPGAAGAGIQVTLSIEPAQPGLGLDTGTSFASRMLDNARDLASRGHALFWCGKNEISAAVIWDTSRLTNGPHVLRLVARDGTAVETQGQYKLPVIIQNKIPSG